MITQPTRCSRQPWNAKWKSSAKPRAVSDDFQKDHPEIPWRGIISQRHFLAHEYGEVRQEKLWRVATMRIPELIEQLEKLIPPVP